MKIKEKTIQQLKKKLDIVFSQYIRLRNSNEDGFCKCLTCGKIAYWKDIQCGHYLSRRHLTTRWEEKNTAVQCVKCNIFTEGNKNVFALKLIEKYGKDILKELEIKKNNKSKMTKFEYEVLIADYKQKVKELKK